MKVVKLDLKERSYKIIIKNNIFADVADNHFFKYKKSKAIIITDKNVAKYYVKKLISFFKKYRIETQVVIISPGEKSKSLSVIEKVSEKLLKDNVKRNDIIYALGGGVVGDFSGFLASIILRGIKFIQIPTTLLSQVDSSVGGKTGVNSKSGKNLIGSFYQPCAVFIDPSTLLSLPHKEFLAGYSEVLKYSMINDKKFFLWLDKNYKKINSKNYKTLTEIIAKCCLQKAKIVKKDEKENNHRMLLNLGHTFAHAIEKELNFKIRHGEAVSVGLLMAMKLSVLLNKTKILNFNLIKSHLIKLELPISLNSLSSKKKWNIKRLIKNMQNDKKRVDKNIKFILLNDIGKAYIESTVSHNKIQLTIQEFING